MISVAFQQFLPIKRSFRIGLPSTHYFLYSTVKPSISLLSKLRKETQISISKAKEALIATNNDYASALSWLQKDASVSGLAKANKLASRTAAQGWISAIDFPGNKGSVMIEVNCETDFVARNEIFQALTLSIANAAYVSSSSENLLQSVTVNEVLDSKIGEKTVNTYLTETIGHLGEKIVFRRGVVSKLPQGFASNQREFKVTCSHVHGGGKEQSSTGLGRIGCLVCMRGTFAEGSDVFELQQKVQQFGKRIAQQIVGFAPQSITPCEAEEKFYKCSNDSQGENLQDYIERTTLLRQSFLFGGNISDSEDKKIYRVSDALRQFTKENESIESVGIENFTRFECGEGIEIPDDDFAAEVQKQAHGVS